MKLEIYEPTKEGEEIVRLRLVRSGGIITLAAVDEDGETLPNGWLLRIRNDGSIRRAKGVEPCLPFELDSSGRVLIS